MLAAGATVVPFNAAPAETPGSRWTGADGGAGAATVTMSAPGGGGASGTTSVVVWVPSRASHAAMTTAAARARSSHDVPASSRFSPIGSPEARRRFTTSAPPASLSVTTSAAWPRVSGSISPATAASTSAGDGQVLAPVTCKGAPAAPATTAKTIQLAALITPPHFAH